MALGLAWVRGAFVPVLKDTRPIAVAWGPLNWTWQLAPVKSVQVRAVSLTDGSPSLEPIEGLQCWEAFPVCRMPGASPLIERRGPEVGDGFRPVAPPGS